MTGADPEVKVGGKVERSAEGASRVEAPKAPKRMGCGERVYPSLQGEGPGEEAVPLPRIFLDILGSKWRFFVHFGAEFFFYNQNILYARNAWTAMEIDLHAIKNVIEGRLFSLSSWSKLLSLTQSKTPQASRMRRRI